MCWSYWSACEYLRLYTVTNTSPALYRDEDKLHAYRGSQASKSSIDIYSCAGNLIHRLNVGRSTSRAGLTREATTDLPSGIKVRFEG